MVSPVKQEYGRTFSSAKGWECCSFLMEHEHFSYQRLIKYLQGKYNYEIEETEPEHEEKEQTMNARVCFLGFRICTKNIFSEVCGKGNRARLLV